MKQPASISKLIEEWDTIAEFSAAVGCGYEAARKMRRRESIAPEHWQSVLRASREKGIPITLEWLATQRAPERAA